jgi:pimeloyl-ACP methyl ester carboxylesterase
VPGAAPSDDELLARSQDVALLGEQAGNGVPVVLLHGLTATRRYVVMGSRLLERSGYRVVAYDARGHGRSGAPAERKAYTYEHLRADLQAVLDAAGFERALLAGASMGAHTALSLALRRPERVRALCLITPSFDPSAHADLSRWDALARGLREGGIEGFVSAYGLDAVPERWRATVEKVLHQRLSQHADLGAVADALEAVPRSRPFEDMHELERVAAPTIVVASRDEADPGHPQAVAERYAQAIPGARLVLEDEGASPIAWQGGALSRLIAELATVHT